MTATFDRDHAHTFLTAFYSGQRGWLQIVDSGRNFFGEAFTTDEAGLAAAADYAAARDATQPKGIYWRATTMTVQHPTKVDGRPGRGGADITQRVPMLWADLDYGDEGHKRPPINKATGKPQLPNPPTQEDAHSLIAAAGLPEPTILVHSGGGLYPLWVLDHQVGVDMAATLSEGIQEAILRASNERGWHYGTGVSDLARVLRLPGSVNRKSDNPRPCRVIAATGKWVTAVMLPMSTPKAPKPAPAAKTAPRSAGSGVINAGGGVFDALAENTSWADILEPAGWTFVAEESHGWQRWLRPGGSDSEYSARAFEHNLVCHSESAGLPSGSGQRLTKGRVYAWLWYDGDLSAAARGLIQGDNLGNLPGDALDAIRKAADPWAAFGFDSSTFTVTSPVPATVDPTGATDAEMRTFLATYTRFQRPDRLGRRLAWMRNDPIDRLPWHAVGLTQDAIAGHYPARAALNAIHVAYRHHGGQDPAAPRHILSAALGALLNAKVSAAA